MANSYICCYMHFVFSTLRRERTITDDFRADLWAYMGGVARDKKMKALEVNGTDDHVHLVISMSPTVSISEAMNMIKGASSTWVNDHRRSATKFHWQEGYGAFSVSVSQLETVREYVRNQAEHHKKLTYQDELRMLLKKHGVEYDERYVWG